MQIFPGFFARKTYLGKRKMPSQKTCATAPKKTGSRLGVQMEGCHQQQFHVA